MQYDAVIFDCDGVLIDSEPVAVTILARDLAELGLSLTEVEVHHRFTGWSTTQVAETVSADSGVSIPGDWVRRHNAQVREAVAATVEPIPGIIDVLDALDAAGVRWGVASQSGLDYLERALTRVGIWQRAPGRVASSQMVERPKPAPDVYLKAMDLVGVDPRRAVVVEDSPTGVRAGVASGATVIGFAAASAPDLLLAAGAAAVVPSMPALLRELGLTDSVAVRTAGS